MYLKVNDSVFANLCGISTSTWREVVLFLVGILLVLEFKGKILREKLLGPGEKKQTTFQGPQNHQLHHKKMAHAKYYEK